jgi:hypothetical protein
MTSHEPTPVSIEQDQAEAIGRVQLEDVIDDNVIQFPVKFVQPPDFSFEEQSEIVDQADPRGTDREEVDFQINKARYKASKASIESLIAKTHMDKQTEIVRAADYSERSVDPDVVADARSEITFAETSALARPAGSKASSLGSTALRINVR